jgi:Holliday junction resolvasome RuvABC DNA-binding subunit
VIIELKTKLGSVKDLVLDGVTSSENDELLLALTGMGFSKNEAIAAVKNLPPEIKTIEEKIRLALKSMGQK